MSNPDASRTVAGPLNPKILFAVIASTALASMGITVTSLIAPQLAVAVRANPLQVSLMVNGFLTALAATVLIAGAIATRYGRRRALLFGNILGAVFLMVSCIPNPNVVILGRLGCGIAAAFILPISLSVISAVTVSSDRVKAIALWSALGLSFGPIGNIVSGALVGWLGWWGYAFLWSVPFLLGAAWLTQKYVPQHAGEVPENPIDWVGGSLSMVSITLLVYVLSAFAGGMTPTLYALLAVAAIGFVALFAYEQRRANPLVRPSIFRARPLAMAAVCALVVYGSLFGGLYIAVQYMSNVLGYSTLAASAGALPISLVSMALGAYAGRLVTKTGSRNTIMSGLFFIAAGFLLMLTWGSDSPYLLLALTFSVFGVGTGLCGPPIAAAYMSSVTDRDAGMASGIQDVSKDLGGAIGIALFGSIFTIRYTDFFGASTSSATAQGIHDSIASSFTGAQLAAKQYPDYASQILEAAKQAFLNGRTSAISIGIDLVVVAFVLVWRFFPGMQHERAFYAKVGR